MCQEQERLVELVNGCIRILKLQSADRMLAHREGFKHRRPARAWLMQAGGKSSKHSMQAAHLFGLYPGVGTGSCCGLST